jgi:hypothetical protein
MATRSILIDGVEVLIEVDSGPHTGGLAERGAIADKVRDVGQDLRVLLLAVTQPVRDALAASQPEEWSVELNLGFKGEAGVPCLTKGEANGSIKVTAKWKHSPTKGGQTG